MSPRTSSPTSAGRGEVARTGLRGGYDLLELRGAGEEGIEVQAKHRDRDGQDHRLQPGRKTVIIFKRTLMVYKRGHAPEISRPTLGDTT